MREKYYSLTEKVRLISQISLSEHGECPSSLLGAYCCKCNSGHGACSILSRQPGRAAGEIKLVQIKSEAASLVKVHVLTIPNT